MPEDTEETALEVTTPPLESHQYSTWGSGDSLTVLDDFAAGPVAEFHAELAALNDDDTPATNLPENTNTDHSKLIEQLGGTETATALAKVLADPNADLTQILDQSAIESLVWNALDSPSVQATVLADPAVLAAISNQLFFGHSVQDIQALLAQYQRGDGVSEQQLEAQAIAAETRVQNFQHDFFVSPVDQVVNSFGIDTSNRTEEIQDALRLAQSKFLTANYGEFIALQSAAESGQVPTVSAARLQNKWSAYLLKEIGKLSGKTPAKVKTKSMNTHDSTKQDDRPTKKVDITDGHGQWVNDFTAEFRKARHERGLLTDAEKRQQGVK